MASTNNTFNDQTSLRQDKNVVTVDQYQSMVAAKYNTQNFHPDASSSDLKYDQHMGNHLMVTHDRLHDNHHAIKDSTDLRHGHATNKRYINQVSHRSHIAHATQSAGIINNGSINPDLSSDMRYGKATTTFKPVERTFWSPICRFDILPEFGNPQRLEHVMQPWGGVTGEATRVTIRRMDHESRMKSKLFNPDSSYQC